MTELNNNDMNTITGGSLELNGSILSALVKGITALFSVGEAAGSAIRRIVGDSYCPLD